MRLPVQFDLREGSDEYRLLATVPQLDPKSVQLSMENGSLVIQGLRLPSPVESQALRLCAEEQLRNVFHRLPQLANTPQELEQAALEAFLEAGRGLFGRFREVIPVPRDV